MGVGPLTLQSNGSVAAGTRQAFSAFSRRATSPGDPVHEEGEHGRLQAAGEDHSTDDGSGFGAGPRRHHHGPYAAQEQVDGRDHPGGGDRPMRPGGNTIASSVYACPPVNTRSAWTGARALRGLPAPAGGSATPVGPAATAADQSSGCLSAGIRPPLRARRHTRRRSATGEGAGGQGIHRETHPQHQQPGQQGSAHHFLAGGDHGMLPAPGSRARAVARSSRRRASNSAIPATGCDQATLSAPASLACAETMHKPSPWAW